MSRFVSQSLALLLFITACGSEAFSVRPAGIQPFILSGSAYVGGFHAGNAALEFAVMERGYVMRFNAESQGLIKLLFNWGFELEAQGTFVAGSTPGIRPTTYQSRRYSRGSHVARHVRFHAGVAEAILPAGADPYPFPVPAEERTDVLDPASALLAAGVVLARTGRCDQTLRVFDGKTRSNMVLTDRGEELLSFSDVVGGRSIARRCSFRSHRVAGYSERQVQKPPVEGDMWFLPHSDSLMLPVRLETPTRLGTAIFHFQPPAG